MNATFFTSDLHFGHDKIRFMCNRPFETVEQMNRVMIENWNRLIDQHDNVYLLGDVFLMMTQKEALAIRAQLNGNIHLILGNHDQIAKSIPRAWSFVKESYLYTTKEPESIAIYLHHFSHRTWPKSHKGAWHLYGHSHGNLPDDPNLLSFDVGVDVWGFQPVSLQQVMQAMEHKKQVQERNRLLMAEFDELLVKARRASRGPYFSAGWTVGARGFEVGQEHSRSRVAADMIQADAEYLAAISPEKLQMLIAMARGVQPEVRA